MIGIGSAGDRRPYADHSNFVEQSYAQIPAVFLGFNGVAISMSLAASVFGPLGACYDGDSGAIV